VDFARVAPKGTVHLRGAAKRPGSTRSDAAYGGAALTRFEGATFVLVPPGLCAAGEAAAGYGPVPLDEPGSHARRFVGETLRGHYRDGTPWTASYGGSGQYDVREGELRAVGNWYFRDRAFCFFYGPPVWRLEERCVATVKVGANCYEFHLVWPDARDPGDEEGFRPALRWHSRGWRQREPSTCDTPPSA
jgi:hypothetical protein